jgi:RimJ/RimL family protein N-acetyltransferase
MSQVSPFSSARLNYRAIRPADSALFAAITADTVGYINSSTTNIHLATAADADGFMKECSEEMLLGAAIWLKHSPDLTPHQIDVMISESKDHGREHMVEKYGVAIGEIHLRRLKPDQAHHRFTEIGLDILPEYQGKGYGGEAITWALDYAFRLAGLNRVRIRAFEWNAGALRLYERLGFKHEGREREAYWHEGRFWDGIEMGMLEREWREMQEEGKEKMEKEQSVN